MKRKTSLEDTIQLPVMLVSAADETRETNGGHAGPDGPRKRSQTVIRAAAVLLLLAVGGLVVYGASGTTDTPAVGPANPPPPGPESPASAPAVATGTMTVPTTTTPRASAKVQATATSSAPAAVNTTAASPPKPSKTDTGAPPPADYSAILSSLAQRYHPHHQH
jgi:hypothetical protein